MFKFIQNYLQLKRENEMLKKENEIQKNIINTYIDTSSNENKVSEKDSWYLKVLVPDDLYDPKLTGRFNLIGIILIVFIYISMIELISSKFNNSSFLFSITSIVITTIFVNYLSSIYKFFIQYQRIKNFNKSKSLFDIEFNKNYKEDLSYVRLTITFFIIMGNLALFIYTLVYGSDSNRDINIKDSKVNITCNENKNHCNLESKSNIKITPSKD
ncbi:hypothetical protein [Staphylococcus epidermidis]|nr:hypothetical protein [Staphylococcus epidermidis]EJE44118.1 hypothetical protein HMPREF1386_10044 [Staphylococcus epidermidis NIH051668]KAB2239205.1 hypothetical protein F9B35_08625 [Staphylococcus epidermidis]KAB2313137.1 hypothetical protein F9B75_07950 [Staphylococcus epidermidis]RLY76630.1 hypothetical protein D9V06_12035 [Staphylococcus epidermidis]RLY78049.1 hypothetical protein D9V05_11445 [Staphylococcus epidermidis]